jgi:hypothetical protein
MYKFFTKKQILKDKFVMEFTTLSCDYKPNITKDMFDSRGIKYTESFSPYKNLDMTHVKNEFLPFNQNLLGAYRCFKAHQHALHQLNDHTSYAVFEDDAVPLKDTWLSVIYDVQNLLEKYNFILLHLRNAIPEKSFSYKNYQFVEQIQIQNIIKPIRWGLGSLAYLCNQEGRKQILDMEYEGLPMDLWLVNCTKYCWLKTPDLFGHERKHGSAVENAR